MIRLGGMHVDTSTLQKYDSKLSAFAAPQRRPRLLSAAVSIGLLLNVSVVLAITLEDAVKQALTTNPEILGTASDVQAASHYVRQAKAGYDPSLD